MLLTARLCDVIHTERKLTLVSAAQFASHAAFGVTSNQTCFLRFEYLDQDLKKLLDMCDGGLDPATTKAIEVVSAIGAVSQVACWRELAITCNWKMVTMESYDITGAQV